MGTTISVINQNSLKISKKLAKNNPRNWASTSTHLINPEKMNNEMESVDLIQVPESSTKEQQEDETTKEQQREDETTFIRDSKTWLTLDELVKIVQIGDLIEFNRSQYVVKIFILIIYFNRALYSILLQLFKKKLL